MPLIQNSIVEQKVSVLGWLQQGFGVVPQQTRSQFLAAKIAVNAVMADTLQMVSQIRHGVVDRTAQQILAVVQFGKAHFFSLEPLLRKPW
jgi:hypothetical protein